MTWGNGTSGINGTVSSSNSLVGTKASDQVGAAGVRALTNSNYVICSPYWDNGSAVDAGAATWGNGLTGISGSISASNSLVSTLATDMVGSSGVTALTNGNYVVISPYLDNGSFRDAGAVTWGNGLTGISGSISTTNSLIGTRNLDMVGFGGPTGVTALTNGNYVVNSPWWGLGGAVTWGNGLTGISGVISSTNSLTGTVIHDDIGSGGVTALTNGNYVVNSPTWDNGTAADVGAVSWGNGLTGISGSVSSTNSLIGKVARDQIGFRGVTALTNGNYVINSPDWDNGSVVDAGAVTWGNGLSGLTGTLSSTNSLVGTGASDRIGSGGVTALTNGNYVVCSPNWSVDVGAVTWSNGSTSTKVAVSTTNSLTGNVANDFSGSRVTAFSGGNYVVVSPLWNNGSVADAGAVTWANGTTSITGKVSTTNSAVGNSASSGLIEYASCFFGLDSFFVSFAKDGSGRVLSGTQSNGFYQTSGSLNSGGGAIALQGNLVNLQTSACTTSSSLITIKANGLNITGKGAANATISGKLGIKTLGAGINLGDGKDTALNLGLSQGELNNITAGVLTLGNSNTDIGLTTNMSWSSDLVLWSNLSLNGSLANNNHTFTQGSNNITTVGAITIIKGTASILPIAGDNQSATVGADFANLIKVRVTDSFGNPVPNLAISFTVNANGASGTFATTSVVNTDASGYATASKLTANTISGLFTVTASAEDLVPLTFTLTNNPGAASKLTVVDGNNQSAVVGNAFAKTLQLIAKDTYGNAVPGVSVVFATPSTGASGSFATSSTVTTSSSGLAASPVFTANTLTGGYTVTAAVNGLTALNFSLTNSAGAASTLAIVDGNNQSTSIGNAFTKTLQAVVKDTYGNFVPGASVTFTAPSSGASGTFATSSTVTTNSSGVAVSPVLTANSVVGSFMVTASTAGTSNITFNLTNNQDSTSTTVTSGTNPSVFGQSVTFTATVAATTSGAGVPTGVVTFKDGTTTLGTGTLNSSRVATFATSALIAATHTITAVYAGDTNFTTSTSANLSQVVKQAATSTTVVSGTSPSFYSQSVTFTATVAATAPGTGIPTGVVTFKDGTTTLGTGSINSSGVATFATSALNTATHTITAVYAGDSNFTTSTSASLSQIVKQAATSTTVVSDVSPSVYGQSVTFTSTVSSTAPATGVPTGVVTFKDGTTTLGTGTLNSSGIATYKTSIQGVATHTITAIFAGDTNFTTSTSANLSQVVKQAATSTTVISSASPSVYGQPVTFTVTVTSTAPGTGIPTGIVTFKDGTTTLGTGTLNGSGVATYTNASLAVTTHTITAVYAGDTNFTSSTSSNLSQLVNQATSTTSVTSSASPSLYGQPVIVTAKVIATAPGTGTPTGTVVFKEGATVLATGTLDSSGLATFTTSSFSVASHTISVVYSGDTNFISNISSNLVQIVNRGWTSSTTVSSINPSVDGQSVSFIANVVVTSPGAGTPSGVVTFKDGTTVIGTGILNNSGVATFTSTSLAIGSHTISSEYAGSENFISSISNPLAQSVGSKSHAMLDQHLVYILDGHGAPAPVMHLIDPSNNYSVASLSPANVGGWRLAVTKNGMFYSAYAQNLVQGVDMNTGVAKPSFTLESKGNVSVLGMAYYNDVSLYATSGDAPTSTDPASGRLYKIDTTTMKLNKSFGNGLGYVKLGVSARGVSYDSDGNTYVCVDNKVAKISSDGTIINNSLIVLTETATSLTVDKEKGELYLAHGNTIDKYNLNGVEIKKSFITTTFAEMHILIDPGLNNLYFAQS